MLLRNEVTVTASAAGLEMDKVFAGQKGLDKANVEFFDIVQAFLAKYFNKADGDKDNVRRVEIKLEATPNLEQLKELMAYSSDFPEDGWADVIFIDENDVKTSIKKHRIVERIMLGRAIDAYSCDVLYAAIKDNREHYLKISRLEEVASKSDAGQEPAKTAESKK